MVSNEVVEWRVAVSTTHPELVKDLEVSSDGNVRHVTSKRHYKGTNDCGKPTITRHRIGLRVHHLVAETFIAKRTEHPGMNIKHKDGDVKNNNVSNLEYETPQPANYMSPGLIRSIEARIEKARNEIKKQREIIKTLQESLNPPQAQPTN
jgi:hypothetical protein